MRQQKYEIISERGSAFLVCVAEWTVGWTDEKGTYYTEEQKATWFFVLT